MFDPREMREFYRKLWRLWSGRRENALLKRTRIRSRKRGIALAMIVVAACWILEAAFVSSSITSAAEDFPRDTSRFSDPWIFYLFLSSISSAKSIGFAITWLSIAFLTYPFVVIFAWKPPGRAFLEEFWVTLQSPRQAAFASYLPAFFVYTIAVLPYQAFLLMADALHMGLFLARPGEHELEQTFGSPSVFFLSLAVFVLLMWHFLVALYLHRTMKRKRFLGLFLTPVSSLIPIVFCVFVASAASDLSGVDYDVPLALPFSYVSGFLFVYILVTFALMLFLLAWAFYITSRHAGTRYFDEIHPEEMAKRSWLSNERLTSTEYKAAFPRIRELARRLKQTGYRPFLALSKGLVLLLPIALIGQGVQQITGNEGLDIPRIMKEGLINLTTPAAAFSLAALSLALLLGNQDRKPLIAGRLIPSLLVFAWPTLVTTCFLVAASGIFHIHNSDLSARKRDVFYTNLIYDVVPLLAIAVLAWCFLIPRKRHRIFSWIFGLGAILYYTGLQLTGPAGWPSYLSHSGAARFHGGFATIFFLVSFLLVPITLQRLHELETAGEPRNELTA